MLFLCFVFRCFLRLNQIFGQVRMCLLVNLLSCFLFFARLKGGNFLVKVPSLFFVLLVLGAGSFANGLNCCLFLLALGAVFFVLVLGGIVLRRALIGFGSACLGGCLFLNVSSLLFVFACLRGLSL